MKKLLMIMPLVILLCFAAEYSNAQLGPNIKYTITLQNGKELPPGTFMLLEYRAPGLLGSDERYYHFEVNKVETHRAIPLHKVESIEFIANEEDKSSIEQVKVDLWDGSKVIYKKVIDANDLIEEISPDGEKKTYKSTGFLCYKKPKETKRWYLSYITANSGEGTFRDNYNKIRMIKFHK